MKKIVLIAAVAALSACSQKAEEAPVPAETTAAEAPAPAATPVPGTYQVKYADGSMGEVTINADGTFSGKDGKGVESTGTFAVKDGKTCFDPEGDAPEMCWTDSAPDATGVFVSTADDGTTVTVTPPAPAAPAPDTMAAPAPAAT